jgi:large subunit ribosomal protein L9
MEVILKEKVEKLGVKGDVVRVSDGYARNFLFPRKLAVPATPGNKAQIEQEKAAAVRQEAKEKVEAEMLARQVASVSIKLSRKVGENNILYGSVTTLDIAEALEGKGFKIDKRKIELEDHIKSLGQFQVPVKLHREVVVPISVEVVKEE